MKEKGSKKEKDYQALIKKTVPKPNLIVNCTKAFCVGGLICTMGQLIINCYKAFGFDKNESSLLTTVSLIFLGAFLTGFDIYARLGTFAGAGSIIPITGFANSIVSSAIEYKKEGFVLGVGAKMFIIAGPVIVYGTVTSVIIGLIYFLMS